ncbi:hypothetical protein SAY87_002503 [Trapa incisa]|uniref:gibberellin 2beta-dioxygenase n=1 Tax=Trapa incisa TaxID=236973 RepID=A0AAN7PV75_9MYRT|nr:hypothetical protein SAY87_002503 [Trapa incisa]
MDSADPPFHEIYKALFNNAAKESTPPMAISTFEECELPLIDLSRLDKSPDESMECKAEIAKASREWGFFQVVNHGISREILERMRREQVKVFKQPFQEKVKEELLLNMSSGSYRWGSPRATCLRQLAWSEAFHVPLTDILGSDGFSSLSSTMEQFAATLSGLANRLAEILAENMGHNWSDYMRENCLLRSCYLRINRYPPCPMFPTNVFGLVPHTDSDFLTVLHQDDVGGLQLVRDGRWFAVNPKPDVLIVNIGDLFQAWSNGVYKSVVHRVATNPRVERFSTAYFLCPSDDTVIKSCGEPPVYRDFSFREYLQQVKEDVKNLGDKVGLPRFLL